MDEQDSKPTTFTVYWRAKDGQGTHIWKEGLTGPDSDKEVGLCEDTHPEATMVWSVQAGASQCRILAVEGVRHD